LKTNLDPVVLYSRNGGGENEMSVFPPDISICDFIAIEEEWDNILQATINSLINSMRRRYVALHEENGGHTRY
jgi:hypothetical protein